jgi:uncharacterized protein
MPHTPPALPLDLLPGGFAVARLQPEEEVPAWALRSRVLSAVVRTPTELSVLTEEAEIPPEVPAERGYRAFRVRGPLPFDLVGIFASVAQPLAEAGLPIFALSTYDTDYVLVKQTDLTAAAAALEAAGHTLHPVEC